MHQARTHARTHHARAGAAGDGVAEDEALEGVAAVRLPVDHLHQLVVVLLRCVEAWGRACVRACGVKTSEWWRI